MNKSAANSVANKIKQKMQNNQDVIIRKIAFKNKKACLIFIDELCNKEEINLNIIDCLHNYKNKSFNIVNLTEELSNICEYNEIEQKLIEEKLFEGFAVLVVDNYNKALAFNVKKVEGRNVVEPPNSTVINGPREGFTEDIKTNLSLIRKRLLSNKLKIEDIFCGKRTKTNIKLVYFNDLIDKKIVEKIKEKIEKFEIDGVIDSNYIVSILEDRPKSMFRQVGICEKPDILCAKILEGRVGVLVDGSPIVLTVPFVLLEDFQSSNDYYSDYHRATALRVLRIFAIFLSIYVPGMYIALQLYHYKVLPLKFLVTIINTTQNLPLNPFLEIFFIIILFDILFEASIRMPRYLGIAVSIVGALILGDTAVKAGLVSPPGVMIVALSAITIYIIPNQSSQISILRLVFAFIGGVLGFHGLVLGTIFMMGYLLKLDSFGTPYLAPFSPYIIGDQKDAILKKDFLSMSKRPDSLSPKDKKRISIKKAE